MRHQLQKLWQRAGLHNPNFGCENAPAITQAY
jgi:hypothetical protein